MFDACNGLHKAGHIYSMDISFAIGQVSRHVSNPHHSDQIDVKRIFRYVERTSTHGIFYGGNSLELIGLSNANWAKDLESKKSTFGYCFLLARGAIS